MVGASYLIITHPSLINDLLVELADVIGAPALLIQWVGWLLLLMPALYLLRGLCFILGKHNRAGRTAPQHLS
jgi:hypothetical protein